jgi:hypothetical protein
MLLILYVAIRAIVGGASVSDVGLPVVVILGAPSSRSAISVAPRRSRSRPREPSEDKKRLGASATTSSGPMVRKPSISLRYRRNWLNVPGDVRATAVRSNMYQLTGIVLRTSCNRGCR